MAKALTADELWHLHPDPAWQSKLLKLLDVATILEGSLIDANYKVPDDLNSSIALSRAGKVVYETLTKPSHSPGKESTRVPAKEARLLCFLHMLWVEPLIDIENTDPERLLASINKQMQSRELVYPYRFGRYLYDRFADKYPEEKRYLGRKETVELLDDSPAGVFQLNTILAGPYGILKSHCERRLPPKASIPLQHCADIGCNIVHRIRLTTDYEAPINEHRPKIQRILDRDDQQPSDWAGYFSKLKELSADNYDDLGLATLPFLLGDGLSTEELKTLLAGLDANDTEHGTRAFLATRGKRGSYEQILHGLNHAELMQLVMVFSNEEISKCLDGLIRAGKIAIPQGEVRRPRVNAAERSSVWGLQTQMSSQGVGLNTRSLELPHLRLSRLIDGLYPSHDIDEWDSLDWQLRSVGGMTLSGRREEYLRTAAPREIVNSLVLKSRKKVEAAAASLKIIEPSALSDTEIVSVVLWKLGFPVEQTADPHEKFWPLHANLANLARSATISTVVDEEKISAVAVNYFKQFESLLDDSLLYIAWALTEDHYANAVPFTYFPDQVRAKYMNLLTAFSEGEYNASKISERIVFSENNTLYPLVRGFAVLADYLESLQTQAAADPTFHIRENVPKFVQFTKLKSFPYRHLTPFLDLLPESQVRLLSELRELSRRLSASGISAARNDLLHFRRAIPNIENLVNALDAVFEAVRHAEAAGICRTRYRVDSQTVDRWNRKTILLQSRAGHQVAFSQPTQFDWIRLPPLQQDQYLIHFAVFAELNEMLRFSHGHESPFSELWMGYPRRPLPASEPQAESSEFQDATAVHTFSGPRVG